MGQRKDYHPHIAERYGSFRGLNTPSIAQPGPVCLSERQSDASHPDYVAGTPSALTGHLVGKQAAMDPLFNMKTLIYLFFF